VLGALPPEVQAELDRQRIAEQAAYDDALNRIAQERTTGSVGAQEAIREARRAGTGGFIDIAAEAAEGGLGASPGIVGVAQDALRAQEAANVASARKRFMQLASQLGMTAEQAQSALDRALANLRQGELTARAQAGMNYIPQMGGI
jgi:acyl CoA:acetate/3-ketoacid CoA transferase